MQDLYNQPQEPWSFAGLRLKRRQVVDQAYIGLGFGVYVLYTASQNLIPQHQSFRPKTKKPKNNDNPTQHKESLILNPKKNEIQINPFHAFKPNLQQPRSCTAFLQAKASNAHWHPFSSKTINQPRNPAP